MNKYGVFVGRISPLHLGHEIIINQMIKICGWRHCLAIIGSSNANISFRHLFNYEDRRNFLKTSFENLAVVGLPDYQTDREWLVALDDILMLSGVDPKQATFFGGCDEDVRFFIDAGRSCKIINRFDGSTPKISATEVRDALVHDRPLNDLLNPQIVSIVREIFAERWDQLKRM